MPCQANHCKLNFYSHINYTTCNSTVKGTTHAELVGSKCKNLSAVPRISVCSQTKKPENGKVGWQGRPSNGRQLHEETTAPFHVSVTLAQLYNLDYGLREKHFPLILFHSADILNSVPWDIHQSAIFQSGSARGENIYSIILLQNK